MIRNFALIAAGAILLGGCVLYPYESAFETCDDEAGICYRFCEDAPTEASGAACRRGCDDAANQCFDEAYSAYNYRGSSYAYSGPWYGSYGYWRPGYGYFYSFDYYTRGHRYRDPYYDGWRRHRRDIDRRDYGYDRRYRDDDRYRDDRRERRRDRRRRNRDRGEGAPPATNPPPARPPRARPPETPPPTGVAPPRPEPRARPPRARPPDRRIEEDERDIRQVDRK